MSEREPATRNVLRVVVLSILICALLFSCAGLPDVSPATKLADQYFQSLKNADESTLESLFAKEFFDITPQDKWRQYRGVVTRKLGEYRNHRLATWHIDRRQSAAESYDVATLVYYVEYSLHPARETIVIRISRDRPSAAIVAHDIGWELAID